MLLLFLLKRDIEYDNEARWDATHGFVIAAMNEVEARIIAASYRRGPTLKIDNGDESPDVWYAPTTSCTRIGVAADDIAAGVILRDFNAG